MQLNKNQLLLLQILFISIFVVFTLFKWQGYTGLSLWDEGFLWYGVQRVMLNEVPIRDFMAYDPGRYYWSAAFMSFWDDNGIVSLRITLAIFQFIGLFTGLLLIARAEKKQNFFYLLLSAITLSIWMFERHKIFDISLSILLIGLLTFLIERPTSRRFFFTGFGVGLVAVFGRNHGVYGVLGSFGVMFWLVTGQIEKFCFLKKGIWWILGVIVGFMPVLIMAFFIAGFANAFWESISLLLESKITNLPLPVPWPWLPYFSFLPFTQALRGFLVGLFFVSIIIFSIPSILWVFMQKFQGKQVPSALVASSFLAIPYAHYAYSRADKFHLALGIYPLLIGCFVWLAVQPTKVKWSFSIVLCTISLWMMIEFHPGWKCFTSKQCVNIEISGSNLLVDSKTAKNIVLLRRLTNQYALKNQTFIATPYWPGAYAIFERKSPMWDIYALFPRPYSFEQAEIERIKAEKPGFALVFDLAHDGREELRFQNTHPYIYQYIQDNFEELADSPNPAYYIYKAKRETQ